MDTATEATPVHVRSPSDAIDTGSELFNMDCTPYSVLEIVFTEEFLSALGFRRTIDEYIEYIRERSETGISSLHAIQLAFRMAAVLISLPSRARKFQYIKCREYFVITSRHVKGPLHQLINTMEFHDGLLEPQDAPSDWTCALCLSSKDSHLCRKTKCGHYFHFGCAKSLTSPACPLCRGFMV